MIGSSMEELSTAHRAEQVAMFFTAPIRRIEQSAAYEVTLVPSAKGEPHREKPQAHGNEINLITNSGLRESMEWRFRAA